MEIDSTVSHHDIPTCPGEMWLDAVGGLWRDVAVRGYRFGSTHERVPFRHHLLTYYTHGSTKLARVIDDDVVHGRIVPGDVSIKDARQRGPWRWDDPMEVLHFYLDPSWIDRVAAQVHGPNLKPVKLSDCICAHDEEVAWLLGALAREALQRSPGAHLMVDSLSQQLAVALIRKFARVERSETPGKGTPLSTDQVAAISQYVAAHMGEALKIERIARHVDLNLHTFGRRFRATFNLSPHAWLMQLRVERAQELMQGGDVSLAEIAFITGFADQSHLIRWFRRFHEISPTQWRSRQTSNE